MPSVQDAILFAERAHGDQPYGDLLHTAHLGSVVATLQKFGLTDDVIVCGGWLHDTIEDTPVTYELIRDQFGQEVADLVFAVTNGPGRNRAEKHEKTYPKIKATPRAVYLKLADRIANVEQCWLTGDSKLFMYHREYRGFREALRDASDPIAKPMWDKLDKLLGWWEPPPRPSR